MRVLITGARGQVGQSLRECMPDEWEAIFTDSKTLDITNQTAVETMMAGFLPDVVINTAAYTNVAEAENHTELAFKVNAEGVKNLAIASQKYQAHLIHISTDFVFDGTAQKAYTTTATPNPINVYGKSKLAGEFLALAFCNQVNIVRTSSVYSEYGNNFVQKILTASQANTQLNIANNLTNPTYAGDLAAFIIALIHNNNAEKILHFTGQETISWADFARAIVSQAPHNVTVVDKTVQDALRPKQTLLHNMGEPKHFNMDFHTRLNDVIQQLQK